MNNEQILNAYKKDGYYIFKNYLSPESVNCILLEAKEVFTRQIVKNNISDGNFSSQKDFEQSLYSLFKVNYDAFLGAAKLCQHTISMHRLAVSDDVMRLLEILGLTKPSICVKPIMYFNSRHLAKMEGHYKTPTHQDWRSMQGSLNSLIVWIPLVPINTELGAVELFPGSHKLGLLDTDQDEWFRHVKTGLVDESTVVSAEVQPGDVVCFSSFAVHRSGNNITDHIRWSMHFRYNDISDETWIDRNYPHPYIVYRPDQNLITPQFPSQDELNKTFN